MVVSLDEARPSVVNSSVGHKRKERKGNVVYLVVGNLLVVTCGEPAVRDGKERARGYYGGGIDVL